MGFRVGAYLVLFGLPFVVSIFRALVIILLILGRSLVLRTLRWCLRLALLFFVSSSELRHQAQVILFCGIQSDDDVDEVIIGSISDILNIDDDIIGSISDILNIDDDIFVIVGSSLNW